VPCGSLQRISPSPAAVAEAISKCEREVAFLIRVSARVELMPTCTAFANERPASKIAGISRERAPPGRADAQR
jgi:hypothetical protein